MIATKVQKINSKLYVNISYNKYKIDWDKAPSKGQQVLQKFLYPYWKTQIVLSEMRIPGSRLRCDIVNCNKKVIIEYSPKHHTEYTKHFHKNVIGWLNALSRDNEKMKWAEKNNFQFIEIIESDLKKLSYDFFINEFNLYL